MVESDWLRYFPHRFIFDHRNLAGVYRGWAIWGCHVKLLRYRFPIRSKFPGGDRKVGDRFHFWCSRGMGFIAQLGWVRLGKYVPQKTFKLQPPLLANKGQQEYENFYGAKRDSMA